MKRRWGWVGACSTGTSHLRAGSHCDDSGTCVELPTRNGSALVTAVSDGAGSAHLSRLGSRIVTRGFCSSASTFLKLGREASEVGPSEAAEWMDDIRDRIDFRASRMQEQPRSFASTLVGCVVTEQSAVVVHVGDGACVYRLTGDHEWHVPSWPAQGEYAATTFFVTDDPHCRTTVTHVTGVVEEIALFSDGVERLALDFGAQAAFRPFFETMFPALRKSPAGRQRGLSRDLRAFLDSPSVTDRTDDDKTLIMARLVSPVRSSFADDILS